METIGEDYFILFIMTSYMRCKHICNYLTLLYFNVCFFDESGLAGFSLFFILYLFQRELMVNNCSRFLLPAECYCLPTFLLTFSLSLIFSRRQYLHVKDFLVDFFSLYFGLICAAHF